MSFAYSFLPFLLWLGEIKMYFCSFEEKNNSAADRIINIKYEACVDLNKSEQLLSTFLDFSCEIEILKSARYETFKYKTKY